MNNRNKVICHGFCSEINLHWRWTRRMTINSDTGRRGPSTSLQGTKVMMTGARIKLLLTVSLEKFVALIPSGRDNSGQKWFEVSDSVNRGTDRLQHCEKIFKRNSSQFAYCWQGAHGRSQKTCHQHDRKQLATWHDRLDAGERTLTVW